MDQFARRQEVKCVHAGDLEAETQGCSTAPCHGYWAVAEAGVESVPAEIKDGRVKAKLLADRPLVDFLTATDERGLQGSAPRDELGGEPKCKP